MNKFKLIKNIKKEFNSHDVEFIILKNTVCFGRDRYDAPSKQLCCNTSCVGNVNINSNGYNLYINEHHDKVNDDLVKFSIELRNNKNKFIRAFHLPSNQKPHIHKSKNGKKDKTHTPFVKDTKSIVDNIISEIKKEN